MWGREVLDNFCFLSLNLYLSVCLLWKGRVEKNRKISSSVSSLDPEHLQRIQSVEQGLKGFYNLLARSLNTFSLFNSFNSFSKKSSCRVTISDSGVCWIGHHRVKISHLTLHFGPEFSEMSNHQQILPEFSEELHTEVFFSSLTTASLHQLQGSIVMNPPAS